MKYIIKEGLSIECCASAAAMSYGKDLSSLSAEERSAYVEKIWDKHYNVSEHMVKTIVFYDLPRFISMIIGAQRHITITEFSQRRREAKQSFVFDNEDLNAETKDLFGIYRALIDEGVKLEDARKVLPVNALTDLQATLNRETARDIAMMDRAQREASSGVPWLSEMLNAERLAETLEEIFNFSCNVNNGPGLPIRKPHPLFESWDIADFVGDAKSLEEDANIEVELRNKYLDSAFFVIGMPMYSYMQFQRHRVNINFNLKIQPTRIPFINYDDSVNTHHLIRNHDFVYCLSSSLDWSNFLNLRSHASTQEPLREIAQTIKKFF